MLFKKRIQKTAKILLYILGSVVLLLCLLLIYLQMPTGKRFVKRQVQSYLEGKLKTTVQIGSIDYGLPKWVAINHIYIEDQQKDTLFYGEKVAVNISLLKLIWGMTDLQQVAIKNVVIHVNKAEKDTVFNYQFVIDAFAPTPKATDVKDTTALKINLGRLLLDRVALKFSDKNGGTDFSANIHQLDASFNRFQPDRVDFGINKMNATGVHFLMRTYKEEILQPYLPVAADKISEPGYGLQVQASLFNLRDVHVKVENTISGMYYANTITNLRLSKAIFNLSKSIATADSLLLDSSHVQYISAKAAVRTDAKELPGDLTPMPWQVQVKQISLNNNHLQYDDANLPHHEGLDPAHLDITHFTTNLSAFTYSASTTSALVQQLRFKDISGFVLDSTHADFKLTNTGISVTGLYVKTPHSLLKEMFDIKFDSIADITLHPRNSVVTAKLSNSRIAFNDLYLLLPSLKKSFPPSQFANLQVDFNTELKGNLAQLSLPYLQLISLTGSTLKAHGKLYNLTDANRFAYELIIDESQFRKSDILKFVPVENQASLTNLPATIFLKGRIYGNTKDFGSDIITSGNGMAFNGQLAITAFSNPAFMRFDIMVRESSFDKSFILGLVPPGSLPPSINLSEKNNLKGTVKGTLDHLVADLNIGGSYGLITVKGFVNNGKDIENANYDLLITTNHYEIGKLIRQDSILGQLTSSVTAKGTGFNYKTMRSTIGATVQQVQYKQYNYQNAVVEANLNSGLINSKGSVNDPHIQLSYDIKSNVQAEYPTLTGIVRIDTVQLQPLNLYTDTFNFSLFAHIDVNSLQPRKLDLHTIIDTIRMQVGKDLFRLDSVSLIASSVSGKDSINFYAPFATVQANGAFDYDQVGDAIVQYVNHYYQLPVSVGIKSIPDQQLEFAGLIKKHSLLIKLVPGLIKYDDISFNGSFASANADSALNLNLSVPNLQYTNYAVRNGQLHIGSKNEQINYMLQFDTLYAGTNLFYGTTLKGTTANDSLMLSAITQDHSKKDWFGLKASLFSKENHYSFRLKDSLLLNYEKWQVASDNYISYSPEGLLIHHFLLTSDTSTIHINSRQEIPNSPIDIVIHQFNLKTISSLISNDTLFASGVLNAKIELSDFEKKIPAFTGNFTITDLELMEQSLGLVTGYASKQSENNITATLTLKGNNNDVVAKGNYYLNNVVQDFDAFIDIKQLSLASMQGFSMGSVKNATGNVNGQMTIQGQFSDPRWKGALHFDTTKFTIVQLSTPFKINQQNIAFEYPAIQFKDFIVKDSLNQPMKIDGEISVNKEKSYDVNLKIKANQFMLLNAPKTYNSDFYGIAVVDADLSVTGNSVSPKIEGDIHVKDQSNIVIVVPEKSYGKDEGKSIVRFIDRDTFDINPPVIPFVEEKEATANFAQYLNYNLNIEIQKKAALTIIIDPVTGDEINVQGDANLNAGVDPGGHIVLAGNYELDKGYYVFNYQFLQRKFILEKGSQISFVGEPLESRLNITAAYTVNTSSKDLLGNEVGTVDPILANSFNQKIPFKIILYLTGPVNKPIIKFDIQLPEENAMINSDLRTTIENKLVQIRGDETATNKQVFSLLLMGKFVSDQSGDFFKGNGNDFSDIARQSVSRFLSSALNEIAGNILKGVDIDLNLNSYTDYSNGGSAERTDLNIALSKTFINDRLTVGIGKNFGVLGQDAIAKDNNSFIPDVTLGYKLTNDGKYILKAYRKNQFEVVVDGYVVETGIGFVVTLSYDQFKELFKSKRKK